MNQYKTFKKNALYITNNGIKIDLPSYVEKAVSNYRYNDEEKALEKQCYQCKKWFKVALIQDGNWEDIHNEEEIHLTNTRFNSYCRTCELEKEDLSMNNENSEMKAAKDQEKYSIYMSEEHRKYLKVRAAIEERSMKELIYMIIQNEMNERPIESLLKG